MYYKNKFFIYETFSFIIYLILCVVILGNRSLIINQICTLISVFIMFIGEILTKVLYEKSKNEFYEIFPLKIKKLEFLILLLDVFICIFVSLTNYLSTATVFVFLLLGLSFFRIANYWILGIRNKKILNKHK